MSSSQFQLHGCNLTVRNVLSILSLGVLFTLRDFTLLEPSCWTREHESRLQESRGTGEPFLVSLFFCSMKGHLFDVKICTLWQLKDTGHAMSILLWPFLFLTYVSSPDLFRLLLISIVPPPPTYKFSFGRSVKGTLLSQSSE